MNAVSVAKTAPYYLEERPDVQALLRPAGKRILDVGCAAGELGRALKLSGAAEVVGIERDAEAASIAREKLDRVLTDDAQSTDLSLAESSFDYIVFADVLEHTLDPWTVLASFRRYLKPDGRVIASIPNIRFYAIIVRLIFNRWRYEDSGILDRTHVRFFTWPNVRQMFEEAGYRIEHTEYKYRLFEDQSSVGRLGALTSRLWCRLVAPLAPHFFAFQYLVVAKRA